MKEFKTTIGELYYYQTTDFFPLPKFNFVKFTDEGYTEEELIEFIEGVSNFDDKFYIFIINKFPAIVDKFINNEVFMKNIKKSICRNTDNVDLYKKYCLNNFDHVCGFMLSLYFENKPSTLTEWIVLNCDIKSNFCRLHKYLPEIDPENDLYIMNTLCPVCNIDKLFKVLDEERVIKIIETMCNVRFLTMYIIKNCSLSNVKYFITKYNIDNDTLILSVGYANNYDVFMYIISMIDLFKLNLDFYYYHKLHNNYEIMTWLYANGFTTRPRAIDIKNCEIMFEIVKNVIVVGDYEYLQTNAEYIVIKLIDRYKELFELVPVDIFGFSAVLEIAIFSEKYDLIQTLGELKLDNGADIIHDLKLLQKDQMAEYVEHLL